MRPHGSPEQLYRRRERAIALLKEGHPPVEVARRLCVDRRSVRRWKAAYRKHGKCGIAARPAPGRPSKLHRDRRADLEEALRTGAKAAGFSTELWTCPRVAVLIRRRYRVSYHVRHVPRLLRSMGWTPQRPSRRAIERDDAQIQTWIRQEWPRIRKKGRRRTRSSSFSTKPEP